MFTKQFGLSAFALALCLSSAYAGTYTNDFNTDPASDPNFVKRQNTAPGPQWRATGSYDGSGYMSLTEAVNDQQNLILLPDFDSGATVIGFKFRAKVRIGGGSGRPADGMSINFGDDPGGTVGEEGTSTGISVNLDTWDNDNGDGPAMDIKNNGVIVAHKRFAGDGSKGPYCSPVEKDSAGNPISLETGGPGAAAAVWEDLEITLSNCGTLSVKYKGIDIYKDIVTGYVPRAGRFSLGARTGGANDNQWIDNIGIETDTGDPPPRVVSALPALPGGHDVSELSPIQFVINYALSFGGVNMSSIQLTLNGTDVTGSATIVDDSANTTVTITYTPTGNGYPPDSKQDAVLTYSDNEMPARNCRAEKVFFVTPVPALTDMGPSLFIESEDFNYLDNVDSTAGHYFDFGSPNGSYNTLPAQHDIDYHLAASNADSPVYRVLAPPNGIVGVGDNNRAGTVITPDYKVGWNDPGDWYNFTRTFPNTTYKVYGRFASGGADTHAELAKVTSDPAAGGQTTTILGTFDGDTTRGWDTFCFIPLRDASGNELVVRLNGLTTLRVTCLPGNYDFNYLTFVPTFSDVLRPLLASAAPTGESIRDPLIKVVIGDRDTAVVASSIRLFLDGTELLPLTVNDTAGGAEASYQIPATSSLAVGSTHTARVIHGDNSSPSFLQTNEWSFTVGPFKGGTGTLFVEAEDFNYSDDGTTGGLHPNFGDPDCPTIGKNGVRNVDYFQTSGNDGGAVPAYRPATDVEAAKPGTDGFQRGDHTISCNYIVGWNDPDEWQNYTRDFGTSARYNVYARLASGGSPESGELARITSDPTQPNQTKEVIGQFNSPATGNWDIFHTVPLRDASGALVNVRLGGLTTLRFTILPGNLDFNYMAFVKADVQFITPTVQTVEPLPNSDYARSPRITAVIRDEDSAVVASSLKLIVDGIDVTASSTITDTAAGAEIAYQTPDGSPVGTAHTVRVDWQDNQATPVAGTFSWTYREGIYNAEKNLFIEVEDFNTDSGTFIPSSAGHPFNEKSLYNTLGATPNVDYNDAGDGQESNLYRTEGVGNLPHVNMAVLADQYRAGAGPRPGFTVTPDYKIGWTSPNSDWYQYTRDYGAGGNYLIYLRVSHGDATQTMGGRLEFVDDPAVPSVLTPIGNFRAPATGGWDTFTFVPLKDAGGNAVPVLLTGVQTLRYTVEANGGDINYLMLCPTGPKLTIHRSGNDIVVDWNQGRLQSAPQITGPWSDVTGAAAPSYTATGAALVPGMRFFRTISP